MVDGRLALHGKKGISELVAAMLLILIAIAGGIIVYVYSSGMLGSLQAAQPQQSYANTIALEYYDWSKATTDYAKNHVLKVILRNVGSGRGILADFFINGTQVTLTAATNATYPSTCAQFTTSSLNPQATCTAYLIIPANLVKPGYGYTLKVITRDGSVQAFSIIAGRISGTSS